MSKAISQYIPLAFETRERIPTDAAAFHICKSPQTLRIWACYESGPIHPIRLHGRLLWSVADIRALLQKGGA